MIKFTPNKVDSMPATPKCNTYAHVNATNNQTSAGDMFMGNVTIDG